MLLLYLSNLHSLTWKMFQVSGNSHTYAKCIHPPPQSAFKMKKHAAVSVLHTPALSLWNTVSHRSSRYRSGNWVTSHTIRYINITGGHWYKKKGGLHSEPFWLLSTMHKTFWAGSTKEIHPCNKPRQKNNKKNKPTDRNVLWTEKTRRCRKKAKREEQNGGLGLRWRIHNQALNPKRGRN